MINKNFTNFNPALKDSTWFRQILVQLQINKRWLKSKAEHDRNVSYAEGCYDVSNTKKKFDTFNREDLFIDFTPVDIFGKYVNDIISIIEKMGFEPKARSTDPTAKSKKEYDIDLLKAEKELAPLAKQMGQALGMTKPLPLSKPEDFSSDISPIGKLGLDISNPIDEGLFKDYFQRLIWEVSIELGITHYFQLSEYIELMKDILRDLINDNAAAVQTTINSYSGELEITKLNNFDVFTIMGTGGAKKDAIAKGWEKVVTVREIIALMGTSITETQLNEVLVLANQSTGTHYQSIWFPNHDRSTLGFPFQDPSMDAKCPDNCCTYGTFLNMVCALGYMEIKSQDADIYIHKKLGDNFLNEKVDFDYTLPTNADGELTQHKLVDSKSDLKNPNDRFLEYTFYDNTYKGFYIPFSNFVFGFGKLPLPVRYGTKNSLTDYSISTYQIKGKSMNEKCQPFILHFFDMWARYQFFINESRPSGESWNIDVVREIANESIGIDGETGKIMDMLKILNNTTNTVHKPATVDGQMIGGDADPVKPRIRGLDPTVTNIRECMRDDLYEIEQITGVNSILLSQAPQQQDQGYRVSQLFLQQSINTIHYLQGAVQKIFSDSAFNICQKIQYIVMGDKSAEAYKALEQALGGRNIEAIRLLGKNPPYSFSIFIEFGLNEIQRAEIRELTKIMVANKAITNSQAFQVNAIGSYKLAGALLAYYEQKAIQMQQQSVMQQQEMALQLEGVKHQADMEKETEITKRLESVANITGKWNYDTESLKLGVKESLADKKEILKDMASDKKHIQTKEKLVLEKSLSDQAV